MARWTAHAGKSASSDDTAAHSRRQPLMSDGNHGLAGLRGRGSTAGRWWAWCGVRCYGPRAIANPRSAEMQVDEKPNGKKRGQGGETDGRRSETQQDRRNQPAQQDFVSLHLSYRDSAD